MAPNESCRNFRTKPIGQLCSLYAIFAAVTCGDVAKSSSKAPLAASASERERDDVESQPTMTTNTQLVSLTAKVTKSDARLVVHYAIHNSDKTPIFVFNRLHRGGSPREVDGQQVYRFVSGDVLSLLLGPAPLPGKPVTVKNLPEVTRVEPYASFEADLSTPLPAAEYNVYFSTASADERVAEQVHKVELFATYVDATGIQTIPSTIYPEAWRTVSAAGAQHNIRSGAIAVTLDVLRQTGEFSRFDPR
jgi:hypothetical protein